MLSSEIAGREKFRLVVDGVLKVASRANGCDFCDKLMPQMVIISSLPGHDEATAAAGILASKIHEQVMQRVPAGLCVLAGIVTEAGPDSDDLIYLGIQRARAMVIILSGEGDRGSLASRRQLQVILDAMSVDCLEIIPACMPCFRFPTQTFYAEIPSLFTDPTHAEEVALRIQGLFQRIAIPWQINASDKTLSAQATDLVKRIPTIAGSPATRPLRMSLEWLGPRVWGYQRKSTGSDDDQGGLDLSQPVGAKAAGRRTSEGDRILVVPITQLHDSSALHQVESNGLIFSQDAHDVLL